MSTKKRKIVSPMQVILIGYCIIILLGTVLLSLPVATGSGTPTPLSDCLFTATSATCVTGLIRYDTGVHWSLFGQIVIITMIQIGGVGFMTVAIWVMILARRKIGLSGRIVMQSSISAPKLGGIVDLTKFIIKGTAIIEGAGTVLLMFDFIPRYGVGRGIYYSMFHAISAFCNAGFDVLGPVEGEGGSLAGLTKDPYALSVLMILVVLGGLGFLVWRDLLEKKFKLKKLEVQSKIVLVVSAVLLFGGAFIFFILENAGESFAGLGTGSKILNSFFLSVTSRTAGFATTDLASMREVSIFFMICLMLVGGSTGSTAGGIKTNTLWVLVASVIATFKQKKNIEAFGRRIDENITRTASCIFVSYLGLIILNTIIISSIEGLPLLVCLYECTSALATVGTTLGITPALSMTGKLLIAAMMLCGRVGSVTMMLAFSNNRKPTESMLPKGDLQVG